MSDTTILVAFQVNADNPVQAQQRLMSVLNEQTVSTDWWIAEDVRYDDSEGEAAVLVPEELTTEEARTILESHVNQADAPWSARRTG